MTLYQILCRANGVRYIGSTIEPARRRGGEHREFDSLTQAARELGLNKGNVSIAASRPGTKVQGWEFRSAHNLLR